MSSLERHVALSSSPQVSVRLENVQAIENTLASGLAQINDFGGLIRALLKRLMDSREACRVSACRSLMHLVQLYNSISHDCLPLLIPVMKYRLADETEPSESQRHDLLRLLHMIAACFIDTMPAYISDFIDINIGCLKDRHTDIAFQSCRNLVQLATTAPRALSQKSIITITMAMPLLKHRHSRLRCAALDLIDAYMYFGAGETIRTLTAFREANVVPIASFYGPEIRTNYFAYLVEDPQVKVRSRFYKMIQHWSIDYPERLDYETLLAPYLFSGFFDTDMDIQKSTITTIEQIGHQYVKDHEDQFYDESRFRPDLQKHSVDCYLILPPLIERPTLGARIIVRSQMQRLLTPLLMEVSDWKEGTRQSSISLVRMLLLYTEEKAATHAIEILTALVSGDDSIPLSQSALDCAQLIGHNVDVGIWMPFFAVIGDSSRKRFSQVALACFQSADPAKIRNHSAELKSVFLSEPGSAIFDLLTISPE